MNALQADVVVIGAGINGVAATRAIARAGRSVVLLEQYQLGHSRGSSHGTSRIFRLSYPDPYYVRLAQRALEEWRTLEGEAEEELIIRTGALDLGAVALENEDALNRCGVRHERLRGDDVGSRWPIAVGRDEAALFQPDGGVMRADRAYAAFIASALRLGAEVREQTRVAALRSNDHAVEIETAEGSIRATAALVTAGAWSRALLEPVGIELDVSPTRETVAYFPHPDAESLPPVIDDARTTGAGGYGLAAPGVGLKAGHHRSGPETDPDEPGTPHEELARAIAEWVAHRYPTAGTELVAAETCIYTNTADESFVLERHGRIVVGSACSGHAFKFAPVTGRRLAELATEAF